MGVFDPYNLNSIYSQTPIVQRPMVPNPPMINTAQQPRTLEKVNGIDSVKQYPMAPNSMVALFDMNDDIFYVKSTDASNYPTIRTFRFIEEIPASSVPHDSEPIKYVTIDEFNALKEELKNGQQSIWDAIDAATSPSKPAKSGRAKEAGADV